MVSSLTPKDDEARRVNASSSVDLCQPAGVTVKATGRSQPERNQHRLPRGKRRRQLVHRRRRSDGGRRLAADEPSAEAPGACLNRDLPGPASKTSPKCAWFAPRSGPRRRSSSRRALGSAPDRQLGAARLGERAVVRKGGKRVGRRAESPVPMRDYG
jgi:hypothetical protein